MRNGNIVDWFTTDTGRHVPIYQGETKEQALKRTFRSHEIMYNMREEYNELETNYNNGYIHDPFNPVYKQRVVKSRNKLQAKANELFSKLDFYSEDIKYIVTSEFEKDIEYKLALVDLDDILRKENKTISFSPYSNSAYGINEDEVIGWHSKPENSYRVSNHWNFSTNNINEIHCQLENNETKRGTYLAKYKNGKYQIINRYYK